MKIKINFIYFFLFTFILYLFCIFFVYIYFVFFLFTFILYFLCLHSLCVFSFYSYFVYFLFINVLTSFSFWFLTWTNENVSSVASILIRLFSHKWVIYHCNKYWSWYDCERMSRLHESFKNQIKNLLLKAKLWDFCSIQNVAWEKKNIIQKVNKQSYNK